MKRRCKMHRLSSSFTLFLKLFLPIFWVVLFTSLGIATLAISLGIFSSWQYKLGLLIFLVSGYLILYFTVFQLKRVDADDQYVYVSNYFKTYRYPYELIKGYRASHFLLFRLVKLYFRQGGILGRSITFLPSKSRFQNFVDNQGLLQVIEED